MLDQKPTDYSIKNLILNSELDTLDTKLLLRHILGFSQVQLITNSHYQLTKEEYQKYLELYNQCLNGYPIQYILGYKEFYSHNFKVTPDTLIPRPETEILVDNILSLAKPGNKLLDLGTGTGCIAISCKLEKPTLEVTAVDKYIKTLNVAAENAKSLGAEIKFIESDWFANLSGLYDIIVSNPPYIDPKDEHLLSLKFEPQVALTDFKNGLACIEYIVSKSSQFLNKGGYLLIEHGYNQRMDVSNFMVKFGLSEIKTISDYAGHDRVTIGRAI